MAKKFDFKAIGMRVVGVGAGAVVAKFADKPLVNFNAKLRGIIKIGAGAVLPELTPKNGFLSDMGAGMIAVGAADLYGALTGSTVSGIGDTELAISGPDMQDYQVTEVSGLDDEPISGTDESEVNGIDEDLNNAISGEYED